MRKGLEEQVVQEFPYRCPYCNQEVSYEKVDLKVGENEIECPSCKKEYIKVVSDISPPPPSAKELVRRAGSPSPLPSPKRLPSARLPALRDHVQGLEAGLRAGRHRGGGDERFNRGGGKKLRKIKSR